jgi:succinyl-diaminopimelate desuccinylase
MQEKYIEYLRYFVGCKTVASDPHQTIPQETQKEFARAFAYINKEVFASETRTGRRFYREEFDVDGRLSLVLSTHQTKTPDVALLMHLDVVDAPDELFVLRRDEQQPEIVIGRGVYDMKFAAAIALVLLDHLPVEADDLSVALIITSDEEKGGAQGAQYVQGQGYQPRLLLVPDGGAYDRLASGFKGAHFFSITTRGIPAHGAYPWSGVNADNMLTSIKARLLQFYPENPENREGQTLNIGASVAGSDAPNKVPGLAEALFDFRFNTTRDEIQLQQHLETILQDVVASVRQDRPWLRERPADESPSASYAFITRRDALQRDMQHPDLQHFRRLREARLGYPLRTDIDMGANDSSFWPTVPAILTMPRGGGEHAVDEWIDLQSVQDFAEDILQFLEEKKQNRLSSLELQQAVSPVL